jgi:hypothetical protein
MEKEMENKTERNRSCLIIEMSKEMSKGNLRSVETSLDYLHFYDNENNLTETLYAEKLNAKEFKEEEEIYRDSIFNLFSSLQLDKTQENFLNEYIETKRTFRNFIFILENSHLIPSINKRQELINIKKDNACPTLLHYAIMFNDPEMVKRLLDNGANINSKDNKGNTPLMLAAPKNDSELMTLLLKNRVDIGGKPNSPQPVDSPRALQIQAQK